MASDSAGSSVDRHGSRQSSDNSKMDFSSLAKTLHLSLPIKLDRNNFVPRKAQVLAAIRALELEEFIDGSLSEPPKFVEVVAPNGVNKETVKNPEYSAWKRSDQLLLCWLYSTLSEKIIGEVTACTSSKHV